MVVGQVGQGGGVSRRIGAGQRGTAEQQADVVARQIVADPAPQQRDGAAGAIGGQHARTAKFQQFAMRPPGPVEQRGKVEFPGRIEATGRARDRFAQQAIGANHRAGFTHRTVDHQQMVAQRIEAVGIGGFGPTKIGAHLLGKDPPAKVLHSRQVGRVARQPDLQGAGFGHNGCVFHAILHRARLARRDDTPMAVRCQFRDALRCGVIALSSPPPTPEWVHTTENRK